MLPDGSGLDLCRQIKSNSTIQEIPILILTAKDDEVDKVVGFELGADDYVTKPFSVRELILRVKAILKRNTKTSNLSNQTHEINRNFGSLKMNIESHEVFINDEEIISIYEMIILYAYTMKRKRNRVPKIGTAIERP